MTPEIQAEAQKLLGLIDEAETLAEANAKEFYDSLHADLPQPHEHVWVYDSGDKFCLECGAAKLNAVKAVEDLVDKLREFNGYPVMARKGCTRCGNSVDRPNAPDAEICMSCVNEDVRAAKSELRSTLTSGPKHSHSVWSSCGFDCPAKEKSDG